MDTEHSSMQPGNATTRRLRQRLTIKGELLLAIAPTLTVLALLGVLESINNERLLFPSLASSAFLIYLDPEHGTNRVRTLVGSHFMAAVLGPLVVAVLGAGYLSAGVALDATILLMIVFDVVHPPAVSTALSFAFRGEEQRTVVLFVVALVMIAVLVVLQRGVV